MLSQNKNVSEDIKLISGWNTKRIIKKFGYSDKPIFN